MLGAHLDSYHAATGATDNAAGVVVVMEAIRILEATGLEMRRTVRVALWGVEEHPYPDGAFSYVRQHLADLVGDSVIPKPTHADLSVHFNLDTGTGRIQVSTSKGRTGLIEDDLRQAAAIMASFVFHAANREEKLPRKPESRSGVVDPAAVRKSHGTLELAHS